LVKIETSEFMHFSLSTEKIACNNRHDQAYWLGGKIDQIEIWVDANNLHQRRIERRIIESKLPQTSRRRHSPDNDFNVSFPCGSFQANRKQRQACGLQR